MSKRLRVITLTISLCILPTFIGCAPTPPNLSPAASAAWQATKVVKALDVLRDIAIDAETQNPKLLSTANTRKVVDFHTTSVKVIGAVPGGWKVTVVKGLDQLKAELFPAEWAQLLPYINLLKIVLAEVIQ